LLGAAALWSRVRDFLVHTHIFRVPDSYILILTHTCMLPARARLHLGHTRHPLRPFNTSSHVMAHAQTNWKPPSRLTVEPVLKVYNTFTRTKVRPFRACSISLLFYLVFRMSLFHATGDASNGIIAVLLYTMPPTWVMQGTFSRSL
jgi:hypothetical protein